MKQFKSIFQTIAQHVVMVSAVCAMSTFASCSKFLDINDNPSFPIDAAPSAKLPSIIANGVQQYAFSVTVTGHYTQNIAARAANNINDQFLISPLANPFNDTYFRAMSNIPSMIATAQAEGSPHYVGAGKIMMALFLGHLTDLYGNIPYSDAFKGGSNFTPEYDTQEQIYNTIFQLLDEGIVELRKPQGLRPLSERGADVFFAGDAARWRRLAFALRARHLNHLTKKSSYNPAQVLAAIDSAMTANTDDAFLQHNTAQVAQTNFWGDARANMNTRSFGRHYVNYLNGTTLGVRDPRFIIIAPDTARTRGIVNGSAENPVSTLGSDFYGRWVGTALQTPVNWYARQDGILPIVMFWECEFIEAEAAFRSGNTARAFAAYQNGIRAHMTRLGVAVADINTYLASRACAQSAATLTLKNIMEQKYIAMFIHPEQWVDMRRMDYSTNIYPGLAQPVGVNTELQGQWLRRLLPGSTEQLYNINNAYSELGRVSNAQWMTTPVWWDRP